MVKIIGLIFLALFPLTLRAQWEQLPGVTGGFSREFLEIAGSNGARVYSATDDGVWLSTDQLKTWHRAGLKGKSVFQITQYLGDSSSEILIAIASPNFYPGGLFRSSDSGATWKDVSFSQEYLGSLLQWDSNLFVSVQGPDTNGFFGVVRSTDKGLTWHEFALPPRSDLNGYTAMGVSQGYFIAIDGWVWRMPVSGGGWSKVGLPPRYSGDTYVSVGDTLFSVGRGISYTADAGITWQVLQGKGLGWLDYTPKTLVVRGNTMLAADSYNAWHSSDGGSTWSLLDGTGGFPRSNSYGLQAMSFAYVANQYVAGSTAGIMTSDDALNWKYSQDGPLTASVYDVACFKGAVFAATQRGIFRSTDNGDSWTKPEDSLALRDSLADKFFLCGNLLFARAWAGGLWRWDSMHWNTVSDLPVNGISMDNKGNLFTIFRDSGVALSRDSGATWRFVNSNLPQNWWGIPSVLNIASMGSNVLVVADYYDSLSGIDEPAPEVLLTTDEGQSWHLVFGPMYYTYGDLETHDSTAYLVLSSEILQSKDGGWTWDHVCYEYGIDFFAAVGDKLMFEHQTPADLLELNPDSSSSLLLRSDSSTSTVRSVASDEKYLFAGTSSRGIWRAPLSSLPLAVRELTLQRTGLGIFPNPAATKSTFSFSLPDRSYISLKLYDTRGTLRATVFEGEHEPGDVSIPFDDPALPNGIYEAVLTSSSEFGSGSINRALARLVICH